MAAASAKAGSSATCIGQATWSGGHAIASAVVVRLHANPEFLADKGELESVHRKGFKSQRDCRFEERALKETCWLTP